jgi:hypothetical protein
VAWIRRERQSRTRRDRRGARGLGGDAVLHPINFIRLEMPSRHGASAAMANGGSGSAGEGMSGH